MFIDASEMVTISTSDQNDPVFTPGEHDITITATAGTSLDVSESLTIMLTLEIPPCEILKEDFVWTLSPEYQEFPSDVIIDQFTSLT